MNACCGALLEGSPAPTAESLMRSRYTAFVRGDVHYLVETHAAETRPQNLAAELRAFVAKARFTSLDVVDVVGGGTTDEAGVVEFVARGSIDGCSFAQRERSRFRRDSGAWRYVDGDVATDGTPPRKVGRNEPCPCGSGQKFKVCHARAAR